MPTEDFFMGLSSQLIDVIIREHFQSLELRVQLVDDANTINALYGEVVFLIGITFTKEPVDDGDESGIGLLHHTKRRCTTLSNRCLNG